MCSTGLGLSSLSTMVYVVVIISLERFQKLALCMCAISKDWSANYEDLFIRFDPNFKAKIRKVSQTLFLLC